MRVNRAILAILLVFIGFNLSAESLSGREIADNGTRTEIEGILQYFEDELYIESLGEWTQIHLGPEEYCEDIEFVKEDMAKRSATVDGFLVGENIVPLVIATDGKEYEFWGTDGRPKWSGKSFTSSGGGGRGREDNDHDEDEECDDE